jgi:phenylalanyl-tRNA synthetase alpha chain
MQEILETIHRDFRNDILSADSMPALDELRHRYFGRKGKINELFSKMSGFDPKERPAIGKGINDLRATMEAEFQERVQEVETVDFGGVTIDPTLPGRKSYLGHLHPLTLVADEIIDIFVHMGFVVESGPEVETVHYNFDMLNTPPWHPARDETDTIYVSDDKLLRTETSPVQIHVMERQPPPVRMIAPGRVYRNEKPDATHGAMFMQVEGLYVDVGVDMADLKGTLLEFYRHLFGYDTQIRFRPHYFPFTEPSAEVDVSCFLCNGRGCRVCKNTGWLEMGGSGMVDPAVFEGVGYDPEVYTGYAFGLGVERIAMLKLEIEDLRMFYDNDLRLLRRF